MITQASRPSGRQKSSVPSGPAVGSIREASSLGQVVRSARMGLRKATTGAEGRFLFAEALCVWHAGRKGYEWPECGHAKGDVTVKTRGMLECERCRYRTSLTAGAFFDYNRMPVPTWFLDMFFRIQPKSAISAREL
jgi:hypothetical protein